MILDLEEICRAYSVEIRGVLHVGAHLGGEADVYDALGAQHFVWVEANPDAIMRLRAHVVPRGHRVVEALVAGQSGEVRQFHVTNNQRSSSMLEFGTHRREHPSTEHEFTIERPTVTIDELLRDSDTEPPNLLVLDLQGAKGEALKGAPGLLGHLDVIVCEVNERPLYASGALISDIDLLLAQRGYIRVVTKLTMHGWGDAAYVSESVLAASPHRPRTTLRSAGPLRVVWSRAARALFARVTAPLGLAIDAYLDFRVPDAWRIDHRMSIVEESVWEIEHEIGELRSLVERLLARDGTVVASKEPREPE